jgi:hypothetical protein
MRTVTLPTRRAGALRALGLLTAAVAVAPGPARAQPSLPQTSPISLRLEYSAPPSGCPTEKTFRNILYGLIRYDPFGPTATERLVVGLTSNGPDFEGTMTQYDATGAVVLQRDLHQSNCEVLVRALGSVLTVWLPALPPPPPKVVVTQPPSKVMVVVMPPQPVVTPPQPSPPPPPEVAVVVMPPQPSPSPSPEVAVVTPPPPAKRAWLFRLGADAGLRLGTAPRPTLGLSLDAGLRWESFSMALEGHATLPGGMDTSETTGIAGSSVSISLLSAALVPCVHWRVLLGCALVEAGAVRLSSSSNLMLMQGSSSTGPYVAVGGRAGVEIKLGTDRVRLRLAADLLGVPVYARIDFGSNHLWSMPQINGAFTGGLAAFF